MSTNIKALLHAGCALLLLSAAPGCAQPESAQSGPVQPESAQTASPEPAPAPRPAPPPAPVQPQAFKTPEEGFAALAESLVAHDERRILRVLGEAGRKLIRSGDPIMDREARDRFNAAYAVKHTIVRPEADRAELEVGADDWPLPLPMVARGGKWRFDARAGAQELVDRRIGQNELNTIETLRAIADAQAEYAATVGRQGAFRAYALRFISQPGSRDGLFWETAPGEPDSPLGPLVADASKAGYGHASSAKPRPFHGYLFRMLDKQGSSAPGGAMDYAVNGRLIGGFAVIAWPAQYANSGYKTFIVNHEGIVWESDLGPNTMREVEKIKAFDPDQKWLRVPD